VLINCYYYLSSWTYIVLYATAVQVMEYRGKVTDEPFFFPRCYMYGLAK
jgi:hypothetical protein